MAARKIKTIGLDTSIVLRLLTGEPQKQAGIAMESVQNAAKKGQHIVVSDLVVMETYFALHSHYLVPKKQAIQTLLEFMDSNLVHPIPDGVALDVLRRSSATGSKPGFVDHMIHTQYRVLEAHLMTFEKASSRLPHTILLK